MDRSVSSRRPDRAWDPPLFALGVLIAVVLWVLAILLFDELRFVVVSAGAKVGIEIILSLASLFGAMILILFPDEKGRQGLRWVALGFILLGLGGLLFGYLYPLLVNEPDLSVTMYGAIVVRGLAAAFFVAGLFPRVPLRLSTRAIVLSTLGSIAVFLIVTPAADALPELIRFEGLDEALASSNTVMHGLTGWYWPVALIPFVLSLMAFAGAARDYSGRAFGSWLVLAMAFLGGSHLHTLLWPTAYSPILTTSSVLRLALTATVVIGGIRELRQIARERAATLEAERRAAQRTAELVELKSDLSRMIAHELSAPLAAIRRFAEMTATGPLTNLQSQAIEGVHAQVDMLNALVDDIRAVATIEQEEFPARLQPVALQDLLRSAVSFAQTLPGQHPVTTAVEISDNMLVSADPERVGQVLRNLLTNAAKYSPDGTPIELRVSDDGERARISIVDQGYGIDPRDLTRIFEKFERGRGQTSRTVSGLGVGLYLAHRIIQAHGSVLNVQSTPGRGSTFSFTLEHAP